MVLFKGSRSRSANGNAFVELKLTQAAINQSTPTIDHSTFTDSLAPFNILISSAANLTF